MRNIHVLDISYGDAGKGAVVDRLCDQFPVRWVVRANGGCQAAHNVISDDQQHHTFAQFGAGALKGVPTYLSQHMLFEPLSFAIEADVLRGLGVPDPFSMVMVSEIAFMTTEYHWLLNRYRNPGDGSTGRGIGTTAAYALDNPAEAPVVGDLRRPHVLLEKLTQLRQWVQDQCLPELPDVRSVLQRMLTASDHLRVISMDHAQSLLSLGGVVFEGAQGVLLDEDYGFHPHTTWSHVTDYMVRQMCEDFGMEQPAVLAVTRAYSTRHGNGPLVPENRAGFRNIRELHNKDENPAMQGAWRVGHLDLPALRYALSVLTQSPDGLYVTHCDQAVREPELQVCVAYEDTDEFCRFVPEVVPETDFHARAQQTARLMQARPVLAPYGYREQNVATRVADLLDLPLAGVGAGPATSDGVFLREFRTGVDMQPLAVVE